MTKNENMSDPGVAFVQPGQVSSWLTWIKNLWLPPFFVDPEKSRIARLTYVVLQVALIVMLLLGILQIITQPWPGLTSFLQMFLSITTVLLIAMICTRTGFIQLANYIFNLGVLFICTYCAFFFDGGIHGVSYPLLYVTVVHAGILLGRRAAFVNASLTILIGIFLFYAENNGFLPSAGTMLATYLRLAIYAGGLTVAASLIYLATESLNQAILRLRQNEASQAEINRRLQHEISERKVHEREQAAVLTLAGAMRKASTYTEIVPIILDKMLEIFDGCTTALSRFTGNQDEQIIEFTQGDWRSWTGRRLSHFPDWEKVVIGASTLFVNNQVDLDGDFPFGEHPTEVQATALVVLEGTALQIGALWLGSRQPLAAQDLQILAAIGNMVANALQRIQLHAETRSRAEQLAEINRLGQFIAETLDLSKIYTQIGQTTQVLLPGISDLFIELYAADQSTLNIVYGIQDGRPIALDQLPASAELLHQISTHSQSVLNRPFMGLDADFELDGEAELDSGNLETMNQAAAYVPMAARGEIVGVLHVRSKTLRRFSPIDLEFLTLLANTAAIFIQNAILFDNLQKSNQRAQAELAERIQAEATIRRHLTAMETSIDGIAMLDASQAFIYANNAFAALYGYDQPDALFGHDWHQLYPASEVERIQQELVPALRGIGKWRGEATGLRLDGSTFQQEVSLVRLETGEITAVVRDITQRLDAEEALRRSQKLESLGVLAGGIAHDFNNFLAGMLGQISLARAKLSFDNPAYKHVEKAITSATRAADLTRQLLAYAGKGNFQVSRVNINDLIRDNMNLLETVVPKQVMLTYNLSDDLPPIEGDIGQIQQVVMNLIMNAAEAVGTKNGNVRVRSYAHTITDTVTEVSTIGVEQLAAGPYICIEVMDEGDGIDKKVIERIFEPFFSTKGYGRGLGLSATLGIIRAHKGGLQVESQVGQGSTFRVYLPALVRAQVMPIVKLNPVTEKITGTVLVIDDEAAVRDSLSEMLEMVGLQVLTAANGLEGLECFKEHQAEISTVVLDVHMPVMNGLDTLRALQAIDPNLGIVLSSGYSEYAITDHVINQPTVTFLQKPYSMEAVLQRVEERIRARVIVET